MSEELMQEGARLMGICNACRYCEGYCAVFPAIELRSKFTAADLNYLANLCHNCADCYYACQYAPPHEFAVNIPKVLAEIRAGSYEDYAWPGPVAAAFRKRRLLIPLLLVVALIILVAGVVPHASNSSGLASVGDFYSVVPHEWMVALFGLLSVFILFALSMESVRCWRDWGRRVGDLRNTAALRRAFADLFRLRYLNGGGTGCAYADGGLSQARRWFHHFTFYGFLLCFASTSAAAVYHYVFGWTAPYGYTSLPVALGTLGGIGLLAGPAGLCWLKRKQDPATSDAVQYSTDVSFIALLFFTSLTGLLLLVLRETRAMTSLLAIHLGFVAALFLTLPYGKFVHAVYRTAALMHFALQKLHTRGDYGSD